MKLNQVESTILSPFLMNSFESSYPIPETTMLIKNFLAFSKSDLSILNS